MILYLSDEEHEEELNSLNTDIHTMIFQHQDMTRVFRKELQYLGAVTHVIVEEQAVDQSTWDTAAEAFQLSQNIPLLFLIDEPEIPETFIRGENYDTLNRSHRDISDLLLKWIQNVYAGSVHGDRSADIGMDVAFNHVWIAAAGLTPGAGTTALAMHLAGYIHAQEKEVAVTERADAFACLSEAYDWNELAEGSYQWGGVIYNHNQIDENIPCTIFDLGLMDPRCHEIWKQCQVKILVADGKPYHLQGLAQKLSTWKDYPGGIILAFTFVPEAERAALRNQYASEQVKVWFVPFEPDLFTFSDDYQELVEGYVIPKPKEKKRNAVIPFHLPKTALPKPKTKQRSGQLMQKQKIVGLFLCMLLGAFGFGISVAHKQNDNIQIAVESVPRMDFTGITRIRMMLISEQAAGEVLQEEETGAGESVEAGTDESNSDEQDETQENGAENEAATGSGKAQTGKDTQTATESPVTEAADKAAEETSEDSTQAPQTLPAAVTPSLGGYHGQIYTGSDVVNIMNQMSGQPVAIHLVTRSSDGWYNYSVSDSGFTAAGSVSSGTALVDTQCSFLCQVIQMNGEDAGLMFVQQ